MIARDGLEKILEFGRSQSEIFNPGEMEINNLLRRDQKLELWAMWSDILDYTLTIDGLREKHKDFFSINDKTDKNLAFNIVNCAFLAQYRYALEFIALVDQNPDLDTILNEEFSQIGLSRYTCRQFKFRFLNVARATEFTALQALEKRYSAAEPRLKAAREKEATVILKMGKGKGEILTIKNALNILKDSAFTMWFPAKKGISTWMGDVRVRRNGMSLISTEQINDMIKRPEPGDILLERHEWYLSNLGLPGFWTHAAQFIGIPEERKIFQ